MSDGIADLLKVAFDEILPIPKTPRVYRPPHLPSQSHGSQAGN